MNTMLVIAHPDDELLSFGPLLETSFEREEELHVVCLTFPSHERITQFFACANHYGFIPHCFGGPDSESKPGLFANKTVSALTHLMQKERIRCVYTHDLFSGDQGRHPQHVETAVMTGLAALNCPTPPVVNYLFYEGHASPDLLTVLTNPDYKNTVSSLNRFYEKDMQYLFGQGENAYHLRQAMWTIQMGDGSDAGMGFLKYAVGYIASWQNQWDMTKVLPDVDLYGTKDSDYEKKKRTAIMESCQKMYPKLLLARPSLVYAPILDIGTGHGYTTFGVHRHVMAEHRLICYDPFVHTAETATPGKWVKSLDHADAVLKTEASNPRSRALSTFFCSIPWVDQDDFEQVLEMSDGVIIEGYLDDDQMKALNERFDHVLTDNFSVTGLRDKLCKGIHPLYSETIYMIYATNKEPRQ